MASILDTFIAFKFIEILSTPWDEQDAFKFGIIDDKGKVLRKSNRLKSTNEKNSFTSFHRIIFNMKRLMNKFGFTSRISSYSAALFLLKEDQKYSMKNTNLLEEKFVKFLNMSRKKINEEEMSIQENQFGITLSQVRDEVNKQLKLNKSIPTVIRLVKKTLNLRDLRIDNGGNVFSFNENFIMEEILKKGKYKLSRDTVAGKKNDEIIVKRDTKPVDKILGVEVFPVILKKGNKEVIVSMQELLKEDAPTNNVGSGNVAGIAPGEEPPISPNFAGAKVFKVSPDVFRRFRLGKGRYERWNKYLNMEEEECQVIYNYVLENPRKPIIIQNSADESMFFSRNNQLVQNNPLMKFKEWSISNNR